MGDESAAAEAISEWLQVSGRLGSVLEGLNDDELNLRGGGNGWSIREYVHHLVESNLVACTLVIAAVGRSGYAFDCSWMNLTEAQRERMNYPGAPLAPAVELLSALSRYAASLLAAVPSALEHEVKLLEAPGTEPYVMTVEAMIRTEAEHGRHHIAEIKDALQSRGQ